ncbi:MAG: O-antigen ligase family protein, partial [Epsilonproteobacteria bacterium]|nr:O-antigen ligase family protein [Campylobacterota bacterium]
MYTIFFSKKTIKKYIDTIFLSIYFFTLPISHFTTAQSISSVLFIITAFIKYRNKISFSSIFEYKNILIVFFGFLTLALISLFYTPDVIGSLKEIKSELIRNFILMFIFFYYFSVIESNKLEKTVFITFFILFVHSVINIFIWFNHGGWPFRAGGLLDSGGGERFGIWITYALSASIALFFTKYKKSAFLFFVVSIVSIIANQTRATFVSVALMSILFFILFGENKKIKLSFFAILLLLGLSFYEFSPNFSYRYNLKHMLSKTELIIKTPPSKFNNIGIEDSTAARLSMWKSVIIYRLKDPFVPQEYGRFLYGKSIEKNFKQTPQNLPFIIFAQTHNEFIGILYSLGIVGLLI